MRVKHMRVTALIRFVVIVCVLALACVMEYNPYEDHSNVEIVISDLTVSPGDTIEIFDTKDLTFHVAFAELVDSVTVYIDSNRLWTDTALAPEVNTKYTLPVSFYSAGAMNIRMLTFHNNNTIDTIQSWFYAISPIVPDSVNGYLGRDCIVSTRGVKDKDVVYCWKFGAGKALEKKNPTDTFHFDSPVPGHTGTLTVREESGSHTSEPVRFYYLFQDTTFPIIICKNSNISNDTIKTGDESFTLMVEIKDQGDRKVDSASVQGDTFSYFDETEMLYASRFPGMPFFTVDTPRQLNVIAIDNVNPEYPGNYTRKTFWVYYDSTISEDKIIRINIIGLSDTVFTADTLIFIHGEILNSTSYTLTLHLELNDSIIQPQDTVEPQSTQQWSRLFKVTKLGKNTVDVYATRKDSTAVLASELRFIYYDPDMIDTANPVIAEMIVNDTIFVKNNMPVIIADSSCKISIRAYDLGSSIASLLIDNIPAVASPQELLWVRENVPVPHDTSKPVTVYAVDDSGNGAEASMHVIYNRKPIMENSLKTMLMYVDSAYYDTIYTYDPDHDNVTVKIIDSASWTINDNYLYSKPSLSDTGKDSIRFILYDGYEYSDTIIWEFTIAVKADTTSPVSLIVSIDDSLPDVLKAQKDSLSITINQNFAVKGTPPYSFTVSVDPPVDTVLLNNQLQGKLLWKPQQNDIGLQRVRLTVRDAKQTSHTVYHQITVLPSSITPDPSLSATAVFKPDNDTVKLDNADTVTLASSDTAVIYYTIIDTLSPVKNYRVTIRQSGFLDQFIVNDTVFTHMIVHKTGLARDSVLVTVTNAVNRRAASFKIYVKYLSLLTNRNRFNSFESIEHHNPVFFNRTKPER